MLYESECHQSWILRGSDISMCVCVWLGWVGVLCKALEVSKNGNNNNNNNNNNNICLMTWNKNPGVRSIAIGEVIRRIVAKAILQVVLKDVMLLAGPLQACSGVKSGCEAAVHATRDILQKHDVEGALLVDTINAFNSLNRKGALHNIKYVCPNLENVLMNCYQSQIRLFIPGNGEVTSGRCSLCSLLVVYLWVIHRRQPASIYIKSFNLAPRCCELERELTRDGCNCGLPVFLLPVRCGSFRVFKTLHFVSKNTPNKVF